MEKAKNPRRTVVCLVGKRHTTSCYSTNIKHRRKRWKCNQVVAAVCLVATCSFVSGRVHAWLQCQLHRRPNTNTSKNQALVGLNVTIDCNHHVCLVNIKLSLSYLSIVVKGGNSLVSDFLEVPLVAWQLQGYETGNNFFALKTELVFFCRLSNKWDITSSGCHLYMYILFSHSGGAGLAIFQYLC